MKTLLNITNTPILKGLEKIDSIDILENGIVIIQYSITDEYMKENELYYKNRILKIDTNAEEEFLMQQDYANVMKGNN